MYVEEVSPRRTPLIGKRAISGWKLASTWSNNRIISRPQTTIPTAIQIGARSELVFTDAGLLRIETT
jgi:hypothetical protein